MHLGFPVLAWKRNAVANVRHTVNSQWRTTEFLSAPVWMFDHGYVHKIPGNAVFLDHSSMVSGTQEGSKAELLEHIQKNEEVIFRASHNELTIH